MRVAITICEDAWSPTGPIITQAAGGAELVVNVNASPYYAGRIHERETMLATRAADASVPVLYVNLVGGQDELVFDGASMLFDETGRLVARAKQFDEDLLVVDVDVRPAFRRRAARPARPLARARAARGRGERGRSSASTTSDRADRAAARRRCTRSTRRSCSARATTCARTASPTSSIGLSGGIDSSLVAAIAVDALGPEHVVGVLMPSRFSSEGSVTDADALAAQPRDPRR